MLVFSTQLCELLPFSLVQLPPPLPVSKYSTEYTGSVWVEGVGVLGPDGDHILQKFNKSPFTGQFF